MPARRFRPAHALLNLNRDLSFIENQVGVWLQGVPVTVADIDDFERPMRRILAALDAERTRLLSQREVSADEMPK